MVVSGSVARVRSAAGRAEAGSAVIPPGPDPQPRPRPAGSRPTPALTRPGAGRARTDPCPAPRTQPEPTTVILPFRDHHTRPVLR